MGAGSSTLSLSSHAGHITTIEDDGKWVDDLGNMLRSNNITNINLRHRDRQTNGTMNSQSRGCFYDNYIIGASDIPDGSQDMVSVDGRAHELCLKEAVRLVKPVGRVVVLDNSIRERYQDAIAEFIPLGWLRHDAAINANHLLDYQIEQKTRQTVIQRDLCHATYCTLVAYEETHYRK